MLFSLAALAALAAASPSSYKRRSDPYGVHARQSSYGSKPLEVDLGYELYSGGYKDWVPSQSYYAFATAAGCAPTQPYLTNGSQPIFECLVGRSTETLFNASAMTAPLQDLPKRQLGRGAVNGLNELSGQNADEGVAFVPSGIVTEDHLVDYLRVTFPLFSNNDNAKLLYYYLTGNASTNPSAPLFATERYSGPTALNQSSTGMGQQQRAVDIYAETTFVCPAYWLAEAFSTHGGSVYKYQFSIPPAYHGADLSGYFGAPGSTYTKDLDIAFQQICRNLITKFNPSIPNVVADGLSTSNTSFHPSSAWPPYSIPAPFQIDLNTTCTNLTATKSCAGPLSEIGLVNASSWEGGRGTRCDFWKSVGEIVPE